MSGKNSISKLSIINDDSDNYNNINLNDDYPYSIAKVFEIKNISSAKIKKVKNENKENREYKEYKEKKENNDNKDNKEKKKIMLK